MPMTCFVIMGYGIKNNIDLDFTYRSIIKPCIEKMNLLPCNLYSESKYNGFRADEISGSTAMDYRLVACLSQADIVIADISTMNNNAIYELGARHALKPRSTILLCAREKKNEFKFFDLSFVPIIFYSHHGNKIKQEELKRVKDLFLQALEFAINTDTDLPDNPISRGLNEIKLYKPIEFNTSQCESIYKLYLNARKLLDEANYNNAVPILEKLYEADSSDENLSLLILAKYKIAENNKDINALIQCITLIKNSLDLNYCKSESIFGRLGAIYLRLFNLTNSQYYLDLAIESYRKGSDYSEINLYCPRNYCASLLKIYKVESNVDIIKEYFYTAKFNSRSFLNRNVLSKESDNYEQKIYYEYNCYDLKAIIKGKYENFEEKKQNILNNNYISNRQKTTILAGMNLFCNDLEFITKIVY